MFKNAKRYLATALTGLLVVTTACLCPGVATVSFAAQAKETSRDQAVKELQGVFPVGTTFRSDSFEGIKVTFNGKDSYTVKSGSNTVELEIQILDEKKAAKGLASLRLIFGNIRIDVKNGSKTKYSGKFTGVAPEAYQELIKETGDKDLISKAGEVTDKPFGTEQDYLDLVYFLDEIADSLDLEYYDDETAPSSEEKAAPSEESKNTPAEKKEDKKEEPKVEPQVVPQSEPQNDQQDDQQDEPQREEPKKEEPKKEEPKKEEPKKEEPKKEEPKKEEPKQEEPKKEEPKQEEPKQEEETSKYNRTIVIYLDGTDLESDSGYGTKNVLDMLEADIPESTKVIVVTGGTTTWHMADMKTYRDVAANSLFDGKSYDSLTDDQKEEAEEKAADMFKKYSTAIGSDPQIWEVVNNGNYNKLQLINTMSGNYMVDPQFLTASIDFATDYAPADKYDLIIWDHGSGLSGYGDDQYLQAWVKENPDQKAPFNKTLSIRDFTQAIENTSVIQEGGKFDFIGFDACQMASFEVAYALSDYADYYIASEENEPGQGWDYNALFTSLSKNPEIKTSDLGTDIVDSFLGQYDASGKDRSTLSVVDMSKLERLNDALSSFALILVSESDEKYYDIIATVGNKSHFAARDGFYNSNLLDIKAFVTPFANDKGKFSDELKNASKEVLAALNEAVLYTDGNEDVDNGGLHIYFPLAAYYERPAETVDRSYFNYVASDKIAEYSDNNVNPEYAQMAAKLALRNLAGRLVGGWHWYKEGDITVADIFKDIDSVKEFKAIAEASGVDRNNPDDPLVKAIQQFIDERIHLSKIEISAVEAEFTDQEKKHWKYDNPAKVTVDGINPVTVGDRIGVKVTLDDVKTSLGKTLMYSTEPSYTDSDNGKAKAEWTVRAFDQVWYTLNGQITSMYVTEVKEDGSGFYGYIPLCTWDNVSDVAGPDESEMSRTQYLINSAKENKVNTIKLYVECTVVEKDGNNYNEFKAVEYETLRDGSPTSVSAITELADTYVEILGGADNLIAVQDTVGITSLGTVYIDSDANINIDTAYVANLYPDYYLSDYFMTDYWLVEGNLGKNDQGQDYTGLTGFYDTIPADYPVDNILTWQKSQDYAKEVRGWAAQQTAGNVNDQADDEDQQQDALANVRASRYMEPVIAQAGGAATTGYEAPVPDLAATAIGDGSILAASAPAQEPTSQGEEAPANEAAPVAVPVEGNVAVSEPVQEQDAQSEAAPANEATPAAVTGEDTASAASEPAQEQNAQSEATPANDVAPVAVTGEDSVAAVSEPVQEQGAQSEAAPVNEAAPAAVPEEGTVEASEPVQEQGGQDEIPAADATEPAQEEPVQEQSGQEDTAPEPVAEENNDQEPSGEQEEPAA